ncbi:hypothetical protein Pflav_083080 [Phytohabitans flavus]|uniref:Uncharacterized protein n=1 Tax=Phytohabitans flavus TaxID=1076124 RepID=A0A6F8Y7E0_9ACTN|nr:hypothetical protein Pflav_083080 [Phytohabitans flavus]
MTATNVHKASSTLLDERQATDNGSDMLATMASLPVHHPSRAKLRDQVIESWLPLAQHLANRFGAAASRSRIWCRRPPSG